jgi:hypothetical protein
MSSMSIKTNHQHTRQSDTTNTVAVLSVSLLVLTCACTKTQQLGPTIHSSASSVNYAAEYPSRFQALNQKFVDSTTKARTDWDQFNRFVGELSGPRWEQVKTVYEQADAAGRSEAVVEWMRQSGYITEFIEGNDGVLSQRIGSHVNAQINKEAKPQEEQFDSRPFVRWALKDATSKLIDKRYKDLNEAHRFIDMYGDSLGKKNIKALEKQTDTITEASFIVYVALFDLRQQLEARIAEADDVKSTLDNEIEGLQLVAEDPKTSKDKKNATTKRISELLKIKAPIDEQTAKAKQLLTDFDKKLEQFQKDYKETFEKLIDAVEQKASEEKK